MHPTAYLTGTGWPRYLARLALVAAACFACAQAGPLLISPGAPSTPLWLPAGAALAALLLGGRRLAPGVSLGVFAAVLANGQPMIEAVAVAVGSTASALGAAWLLSAASGFTLDLRRPRDMLSLIGVGAFLAPLVSASFYAAATLLTSAGAEQALAAWTVRWASDAVSVLLITPLVLAWAASPQPRIPQRAHRRERRPGAAAGARRCLRVPDPVRPRRVPVPAAGNAGGHAPWHPRGWRWPTW